MKLTLLLLLMLGLYSCASSSQKEIQDKGKSLVREQASFDFDCPKNKIIIKMLSTSYCAKGCGKKGTYQVMCHGGLLGVSADSCHLIGSNK